MHNPASVVQCLINQKYDTYWWDALYSDATLKVIKENFILSNNPENITQTSCFNFYEGGQMPREAYVYRLGYLTIKDTKKIDDSTYFMLQVPNQEVRKFLGQVDRSSP